MARKKSVATVIIERLFQRVTGQTQSFFTCRSADEVRVIPAESMGGKDDGLPVIVLELVLRNRDGTPAVGEQPLSFTLSIDVAKEIASRFHEMRLLDSSSLTQSDDEEEWD